MDDVRVSSGYEASDDLLMGDPIAREKVLTPHRPSHPDLALPDGVEDDDVNEIDAIAQIGRWDGDDKLDGRGESGAAEDDDDDCDYPSDIL